MSLLLNGKNFVRSVGLISAMAMSGASAHAASSDTLFILDGSGSMWGQIDSVAKIETAKNTLTKLMDDVPADARLGFMTYGTKSKTSCDDVTVLNPLGSDRAAIKESISTLTPLGKTPIQNSLISGLQILQNSEPADAQKSLILVSDGIETCDGKPCAIAATSQFRDIAMKIHVVGFDVDDAAREQLECIAKSGGGQYFDASNTEGFEKAMEAVVQIAQAEPAPAPTPEPVEEATGPVITEFFRDDFDGSELSEIWAVENPNPDAFVVEDGVLLMLSTTESGMAAQEPENLISYTGAMPDGDWDAQITFTGDYASVADRVHLGLRKDGTNFLSASYTAAHASGSGCNYTTLNLDKVSSGKADNIANGFRSSPGQHCRTTTEFEPWEKIRLDHQENPVTLTLSKRGRSYTTTVTQDGYNDADGNHVELTTDQFTSLRSPGELVFTVDRQNRFQVKGEVLMQIDSLVINSVEE